MHATPIGIADTRDRSTLSQAVFWNTSNLHVNLATFGLGGGWWVSKDIGNHRCTVILGVWFLLCLPFRFCFPAVEKRDDYMDIFAESQNDDDDDDEVHPGSTSSTPRDQNTQVTCTSCLCVCVGG